MVERVSKSELKRQFKQVEEVAGELSELGEQVLGQLPGSDDLKEEIRLTRQLKTGARKRQIKYIAKILKSEPLDEIFTFLNLHKGSKLEEKKFFHEAEKFRDQIVNEALQAQEECRKEDIPLELSWYSEAIEHVVSSLPDIDEQELRRVAHQYARSRNKTHYRELFRIIKSAADKNRLNISGDMRENH